MRSKSFLKGLIFLFAATVIMDELVIFGFSVPKLLGGSIFMLALLDISKNFKLPDSSIYFTLGFFVFYSFLSLLWSYDIEGGLVTWFTYFQLFILGIIVFNNLKDIGDIYRLFWFYAVACIFGSLNIIYNFYTGYAYRDSDRLEGVSAVRYSPFNLDPNEGGVLLVIAVGFLIYQGQKGRWAFNIFLVSSVLLMIYAIILTASKTAFALLLVLFVLFLILRKERLITLITFSFVAAIAVAVEMHFSLIPELNFERIFSISDDISSGQFTGREIAWLNYLNMFIDNSFLGVGLGSTQEVLSYHGMRVMSSHNTYLNILAQLGFVGFFCFFIVIVKSFLVYIKAIDHKWLISIFIILMIGIFTLTYDHKKMLWIVIFVAAVLDRYYSNRR